MIKCCNCEKEFENENDLSLICEKQELINGFWQATERFVTDGNIPEDTDTERYEVLKGCPDCLGDECLMDVKD